jgi:hypothetical protein
VVVVVGAVFPETEGNEPAAPSNANDVELPPDARDTPEESESGSCSEKLFAPFS